MLKKVILVLIFLRAGKKYLQLKLIAYRKLCLKL